jgi:predicted nucleic acid-binding protein
MLDAVDPAIPRLVLDTNAALDLLWFGDPRCAALRTALAGGRVRAVTNAACAAEWRRVLRYPALALDELAIARLEREHAALCLLVAARRDGPLPRCRDPDDQIFLELARDAGAIALLTRDAELLRLSRRAQRVAGFAILPPERFAVL